MMNDRQIGPEHEAMDRTKILTLYKNIRNLKHFVCGTQTSCPILYLMGDFGGFLGSLFWLQPSVQFED